MSAAKRAGWAIRDDLALECERLLHRPTLQPYRS